MGYLLFKIGITVACVGAFIIFLGILVSQSKNHYWDGEKISQLGALIAILGFISCMAFMIKCVWSLS